MDIIKYIEQKLNSEKLPNTIDICNKLQELLSDDYYRNIMATNKIIKQNTIYLIHGVYNSESAKIVIKNIYDTKNVLITSIGLHQLYEHCIKNVSDNSVNSLMLMYSAIVIKQLRKKIDY